MNRLNLFIVCFLCLLAVPGRGYAQGGATGAITGTVRDSSGAVVPGAEVQIISSSTSSVVRTVFTGAEGIFNAQLLPAGAYSLKIRAQGFAEGTVTNIVVRVTETTSVTATLRVGAVTTNVQVSAEVSDVDTTNAVTGQSIDASTIRDLPLSTQNFQQLLVLSAGAASDLNQAGALGRGDINMTVNGAREDNNNYLIEGISATDYNIGFLRNTPLPSPDVIQEFKVQTSLYDATQGRNGGGNINAILKSGTKDFHGDLFEFFRNDVLNANDFFFNRSAQPRPVVRQNIFGGSVGGPVGPEAKYGFFFFNYQGTRQLSGLSAGTFISTQIPVLPTMRDAGTLTSTFFPTGLPPGIAQLDPVVVNLLNIKSNQFGGGNGGFLIPTVPGTPGGTGPLTISHPGRFDDDQLSLNLDRDFRGGRDRFLARLFFSDFSSLLPFGASGLPEAFGGGSSPFDLNFPLFLPVNDRFLTLGHTHVFSSRWVNEFRFGFVHIGNDLDNVQIVSSNDLGIIRPNSNVTTNIYKFQLLASGFQIGPAPFHNQQQTQNDFTFLDTASFTLGRHQIRFGGQADRIDLDKNFPQLFNGLVLFAPTPTGAGGSFVSDFQNFLIGAPVVSGGGSGVSNHEYRINAFALFAQDDLKLTSRLTLNLGVRWELNGAVSDNLDHIGNVDPALALKGQNPWIFPAGARRYNIPGLVANGSPTLTDNGYASNWGPRVGLAYDLSGHGTTVARAGYGIYYAREDNGAVDNLSFASPFLASFFVPPPPGTLSTLFSSSLMLPPGGVISPNLVPQLGVFQGFTNNNPNLSPIFSGNSEFLITLQVPRHFVSPNVQQWNLGIQRELPGKWVLEVGYVGTKGTHLRVTRTTLQPGLASPQNPIVLTLPNGQPAPPIMQNTIANAAARAPVLGLNPAGFQEFGNEAWSSYHSLQLKVSRQIGNSYFQGAYTFSKALDATSTGNTSFNTAFNDQTNLRDSYGLSDFDRRHRLVFSYDYAFPFFKDASGARAALLKDWDVSGIVIFQSGRPFTVIDSAGGSAYQLLNPSSTASLAPGKTSADAATHGSIESRLNAYLNASAFTPAPQLYPAQCLVDPNFCSTAFGNLGRNTFRGPFQQNWDFSIGKNFLITERTHLKFSAEFFNLWNHPNFNIPTFTDIESGPSFGAITSTTGTPRLIQFAAKISF